MRIFFTALIIVFSLQSWSIADDIKDFQIEGFSVGDSLLDYFSENEINKKGIFYYPKSKRIAGVRLDKNNYEQYESTQFTFYPSSYIISSVTGIIDYNNIEKCKQKSNEIKKEIEKIIPSVTPRIEKIKHRYDKSGKSFAYITTFELNDGSAISITCDDWAKGVYSQNIELSDSLSVSLKNSDYMNFLYNEAY